MTPAPASPGATVARHGWGRTRLAVLAVFALASGFTWACNSLVGVVDVTPLPTKTASSSSGDDTGDDTPDPNEPIDSSAANKPSVLTVVAGEQFTCAKKPDHSVKCWGDDTEGQTGSGGASDAGIAALPVAVTGILDAVDLAAGRQHACIAHLTGKVSCWGYNLDGQLGNNDTGESPSPVDVVGITNAFAVAAGGNFSCAIRGTGSVACWGGNGSGQLGKGDQNGSLTPVEVPGLSGVIQMSAGQSHACAVKSSGAVVCWGDGDNGQLGNGNTTGSLTPVQVESLTQAVQVSCGERSTCALTATGSVLCWGANEVGQLGTGAANTDTNPSPITVAGVSGAVAISTGANHTCAILQNGTVMCWGDGSSGQLGNNQFLADGGAQASAVQVSNLGAANIVGAGTGHTCATTSTDSILCWGAGDRGQLGSGSTDSVATPVQVAGYP